MSTFRLNKDKAVNSLLYVVSKLAKADKHKTFKILYFADQLHLTQYGRPIMGDSYVKMEYGPVPSFVKNVVDEQIEGLEEVVAVYNRMFIKPIQEADLDQLSASDIECLDECIKDCATESFGALTDKSHDFAYNNAVWTIDYLDMARAKGLDDSKLSYIQGQMDNEVLPI